MIRVRELRGVFGNISQKELADVAGVSYATISRIEKAQHEGRGVDWVSYPVAERIMDWAFAKARSMCQGCEVEVQHMPNRSCTEYGRDMFTFYSPEDLTERWMDFRIGGLLR